MIQKKQSFTQLLHEDRIFTATSSFINQALFKDIAAYESAQENYLAYWQERAEELEWFSKWDTVLKWQPPYVQWFVNGKVNITYNCLDRHVNQGRGDHVALIWHGEKGEKKEITYAQLLNLVCQHAQVLKKLSIGKGDRVAIYMPMIPEAIIAMLACARIGAIHSVVFGGFSAQALADRINDATCSLVITADGGYRRGKVIPLKYQVDQALKRTFSVKNVLVVQRLSHEDAAQYGSMQKDRDYWYHEIVADVSNTCKPVVMDAEDILFILYTSGTTGKPKGIVHTIGGYMVGAYTTSKYVFDLKESDVFWCTADVGWITGHTYVTYGPLLNGITQIIYEGAPDYPTEECFWKIIEQAKVTIFYTAPTAIRMFMKWGDALPAKYDLSSLRLLGSVGEPLNPQAWVWYYEHIGRQRCPIVDTWWQTETGAHMIACLPAIAPMKPGSVGQSLPGICAELVDEDGQKIKNGSGLLVMTKPWPSMMRTIWNDDARFKETYFRHNDYTMYYSGDAATKDTDGNFMIIGRVDDVLSVAGHRIGTMEVESALVDHPSVAEVAVIGRSDALKGQAIIAFVSCRRDALLHAHIIDDLKEHVVKKIGALARPQEIILVYDLPKTRSGKIMRRLLRDIAEKRALGDTTTLADVGIIEKIMHQYHEQ